MSRKRKRKFLLGCVLALLVRCNRVNADLFVEGFLLNPIPRQVRVVPKCGRSYGIISRVATSAGSDIPNNRPSTSYFDSGLNTRFENKQLQKKFKHASQFGVVGNCNSTTLRLFREELIKHMKANTACFGHYRNQPVYHYYDRNTKLNIMVDFVTDNFISGWLLSPEQVEHMLLDGRIS